MGVHLFADRLERAGCMEPSTMRASLKAALAPVSAALPLAIICAIICALVSFIASGCGASQLSAAPLGEPTSELRETRAIELLEESLADLQLEARYGAEIDVGFSERLDVDVAVAGMRSSIAWISAKDLRRWGEAIPEAAPDNQLRILAGKGDSRGEHVLILRADSYRFFHEPDVLQRGGISEREIEARLRQDLRDFIQFERSRGANASD